MAIQPKTKAKTKARPDPAPMAEMPTGNLPQRIETDMPSKAQQQRDRIEAFLAAVTKRINDIRPYLQQSKVPEDLFLAGCRRAFMRDPKLVNCTPESFVMAVMDCARLGLMPDGEMAALVPFKDTDQNVTIATLIVMYKGFLTVIYRAGQVSTMQAQVIYKGEDTPEHLDYDLGTDGFVRFRPPLDRDDTKEIVGAFAIAHPRDGGKPWVELMGGKELRKVAAVNKVRNGPGKNWPGEMARKAPLRRLIKFLPRSPELDVLVEIDNKSYLEKPPEAAALPSAIPSASLLGDHAYVPPAKADDDARDADYEPADHLVGTAVDQAAAADQHPTLVMENMLRAAAEEDDLQALESRHAMITGVDYGWDDLEPADKARVELLYEELKGGLSAGRAALAAGFALGVRTKAGIQTFRNMDEWSAAMLEGLKDASRVNVLNFWSQNLATLEVACKEAPTAAGPVVALGVAKSLKQASRLVDEHGPFHG
jgi:phage RecT family recombinase